MLASEGVRLPGERRHQAMAHAADGLEISDALLKELKSLTR
jgi:LDH2 family malate/lactate/ureidoglycolate dehydrogenase